MSFQRPPLQREISESVLSEGGMTWDRWDLSNLCSTQNNRSSFPPNQRFDWIESLRNQRRREKSLYPSKEDLGRSLPADIDTSDIFDRSRSRSPSRGNRQRTHSLPSGDKEFDQLNFLSVRKTKQPPIPDYNELDPSTTRTRSFMLPMPNYSTHADETKYDRLSQALSPDPHAHDPDAFSDRYSESLAQDHSRWQHGRSHYQVPQEHPPSPPFISDCSSEIPSSSRRSLEREEGKPVQVEVYPGEFLHLRGAEETVDAIERGHSKSVFCYACGLGLRCVADCDLVICPDCRIMSPVPCRPTSLVEDAECKDEDTSYRYRGPPPQCSPLWSDDDESFHSYRPTKKKIDMPTRRGCTGGVGLGLRIDK
jgi:hypothetical protein